MISAKVDPSQNLPIGAQTQVFAGRGDKDNSDFDVTADGRRFLFTRPKGGGEEAPQHLVLVQNCQSELEAKDKH